MAYTVDAGRNNIDLSFAAWYLIDSKRQVTAKAPTADALNVVYLPVDLKMRGGVTLTRQRLAGGVFLNYVDSYRDPSNVADPKVDSWTTVDVNLKYSFEGLTSVTLNVQNLLDEDPPFVVNGRGTGYDPTNATALGRFVSMSVKYNW